MWPWHLANIPDGSFSTEHFSSANISALIQIQIMRHVSSRTIFPCIVSLRCYWANYSVLISKCNLFILMQLIIANKKNSGRQIKYCVWIATHIFNILQAHLYIYEYHCPCWCRCWVCWADKHQYSKTERKVELSSRWSHCWWWSRPWCHCCCYHTDLKEKMTITLGTSYHL